MRTLLCMVQNEDDSSLVTKYDLWGPIASVRSRHHSFTRTTQSRRGLSASTTRHMECPQELVSWSIKVGQQSGKRNVCHRSDSRWLSVLWSQITPYLC